MHLSTLPGQIENSELPSKYLLEAVVKLQNKVLDIKLTCVCTSEKNLILKTIVTQTKKCVCRQITYIVLHVRKTQSRPIPSERLTLKLQYSLCLAVIGQKSITTS